MTTTVIIGAGLAGLYAAHQLYAAGHTAVVLEARNRIGGRILTVGTDGAPSVDGFELGPSWFWPAIQPAMAALVESLDLTVFPQHGIGDVLFEHSPRERPQRGPSATPDLHSVRIVGGTAALVQAIANRLPEGTVRLNHRVTALTLGVDGITVHGTGHALGAPAVPLIAQQVIVALPPRLFEATVSLAPALDEAVSRRWRATPTWMAPHAKFLACYDRAFWRDDGLTGAAQSMVGPMPEIHDATTASGQAALFGFVGVSAEQRTRMGDEALRAACLTQLVRLFGDEARRPRATLLKDWAADPLTATIADQLPTGHPVPQALPWVTGPWTSRLIMGGSEASLEEPGYLAGAVDAAKRAAALASHQRHVTR